MRCVGLARCVREPVRDAAHCPREEGDPRASGRPVRPDRDGGARPGLLAGPVSRTGPY
ncbi:MAG: hypothetical protein QOF98_1884 [Streptomyces sp.]|nr:hypothetical protein [Streptomyces sp.]